jgi:predicted CoA-binding protein
MPPRMPSWASSASTWAEGVDRLDVKDFLRKENVIAVVGATINPEKWGYKIYKTLREVFPRLYAVNPAYVKILGDRCYPDLKSLPERPDTVITVVPPEVTEKVVRVCKDLGIGRVWMQPGSESQDAIAFCRRNGMECMHGACFVVNGLKRGFR